MVADQYVVAAFAVHAVGYAVADVDVVAVDLVACERVGVVGCEAIGGAELDPVVAVVALSFLVGAIAQDEVIAGAAEGLPDVLVVDDEVFACSADKDVGAVAAVEDVVAVVALEDVVAADIGEDVVAQAAAEEVVAEAAFHAVVAAVAIERVVAFAGDDDVIEIGAAQDDMLVAGVLQVIGIRAGRQRVVTNHQRLERAVADWILVGCGNVVKSLIQGCSRIVTQNAVRTRIIEHVGIELPGDVDLEEKTRRREDVARQVGGIGVRHDQF